MGNITSNSIGYLYISSLTSDLKLESIKEHNDLKIITLKPKKKINLNDCNDKIMNVKFFLNKNDININIIPNHISNFYDNKKLYTKFSNYKDTDFCYENNNYYLIKGKYIKRIVCIIKNNII